MAIGTTNFPTSLDTATELIRAANDAKGLIDTGGASNSATTINIVAVPSAAPADGIAVIVSATDDTVREIISYTGKTGTTITGCTRNLESSGAKTWLAGDIVYFDTLTALSRTVLVNALIALETKLGAGSSTPADKKVLVGTGSGTSGWSAFTILTGSASWNPASTANGAVFAADITITGAVKGNPAMCGFDGIAGTSGWRVYGGVTDTDTVRCIWQNNTGGTVDLATGTVYATVIKQ